MKDYQTTDFQLQLLVVLQLKMNYNKDGNLPGVINDLKKIYPKEKMKEILKASCLVSLLDLASEKNLDLISNDQLDDIFIVRC